MRKSRVALACLVCIVASSEIQGNDKVDPDARALASVLFAMQPVLRSPSSPRRTARATGVVMGGGTQELRARVKATESAEKITKTMKLVAASRAQKAARLAVASKPFIQTLQNTVASLTEQLNLEDTSDIPLLDQRPVKKVGLVLISGDRGLCGSYNAKIIKKAEMRIKELSDAGIEVEIYSIGTKGSKWFNKRPTPVALQMECGAVPTSEQSKKIASAVVDKFLEGELDRVELLYTAFTSMVSSEPSIRTLIPLTVSEDGIEMEGDEIMKMTTKDGKLALDKEKGTPAGPKSVMFLEQPPDVLINALLPLYLNGGVLSALQNSVASELGSRYTAMQAASDNANTLKGEITLQLNRIRQAAITQEISEIVAGANSV